MPHQERSEELAWLKIKPEGAGTRVILHGELDMSNAQEIYAKVHTITSGLAAVTLDLSELGFIDSAGISILDRLAQEFSHSKTTLTFAAAPDSVAARTLSLTGMDQVLIMSENKA